MGIFSVSDFEAMMWAEHAGTIGNNANSMVDMYTENHYANPMNSAGMTKLASHFTSNDPYPITKDTRLAYACKQSYIIDPTGWSIQPIGAGASWPKCTDKNTVVVEIVAACVSMRAFGSTDFKSCSAAAD